MASMMRAQRFYADTGTVAVEDIPIPEPGPGEVLVRVAYCGICHTDLSVIDGNFPSQQPVVTQGHETSGTVAKLGPGVAGWQVGDRVIVEAGKPCHRCDRCVRGDLANCNQMLIMGCDYDGGWAEYTVAHSLGLTRVPDEVSMQHAAILADAVATPFGAVVRTGRVSVGESVGIWGVGGLGSHMVQMARLSGAAPIVAVDTNPAVLERAVSLGADYAFDARDENLASRITEATQGKGLDVTFDAVGRNASFQQALENTARSGRLVLVGLSADSPSLGTTSEFGVSRKQILAHLGYQNSDVAILAGLVARGRLDLSQSISEIVPLDQVAAGIDRLVRQEGNPIRILVQP
ncbi:zinc-binding dehydrogenase [Mycolicibacterium confluentis]|nr:zinc-binding dehydrogenase [Mycolicibacterium confluentis]MCV7320609.1 zinc-binding dehydrogenase [Mycolicibacterium confluentis]ORV30418.1 zinc-binding dehydrogenase [Mycolicibacterium confluentis]